MPIIPQQGWSEQTPAMRQLLSSAMGSRNGVRRAKRTAKKAIRRKAAKTAKRAAPRAARKMAKFTKGSAAARRHMAKLRKMRKK